MKYLFQFIIIFSVVSVLGSCGKSCLDPSTKTSYVDRNYLPYIIPYSDTSTRLFLKNGKDTLLFKSKGLKESFTSGSSLGSGDCPYNYKNQEYSLIMTASDTDYFRINYYADKDGTLYNDYEIINGLIYTKSETYSSNAYVNNFSIVRTEIILNNHYDSIKTSTNSNSDIVISKPKTGILKIKTANVLYEIIK